MKSILNVLALVLVSSQTFAQGSEATLLICQNMSNHKTVCQTPRAEVVRAGEELKKDETAANQAAYDKSLFEYGNCVAEFAFACLAAGK